MNLWMIRVGRSGEYEAIALEKNLACLGFIELSDLSKIKTEDALRDLLQAAYPGASTARISNYLAQVTAFANRMQVGDLIAMPLKSQPQIALGRITGPYEYRPDLDRIRHTRKVEWIRPNLPRSEFKEDLLYSLGAIMAVCQIRRNNAVERVEAILNGKPDPGYEAESPDDVETHVDLRGEIDVTQLARDQIRSHIEANFRRHDLARLVDAVLQAEGYVTHLSPPGPDGGVDILARRGSLGLDGPKLCVQVKSSAAPADVSILRGLQGTMSTFKADEGLLVSWGGFNRTVQQEARLSFFSVRLWDADDLVAAIERNYDRLPKELQGELPLKRIWALVIEEE
jgi:restriction system protein